MRQTVYNAAMAAVFLSLIGFAVEAVDARGGGSRGGGGGARGGASTSISRGGGASSHGGGSGFSRGGNYSKPSGGRASASQLPSKGGGNRNNVNGGNNNISGGNTNISRGNTNINTGNVNNIHVDNDLPGYGGWHDYPIARGVAVGTAVAVTAAAIGASYYALPPACAPYPWHSYTYYHCGGVYYKPQYQGDTIVYITVAKPQ